MITEEDLSLYNQSYWTIKVYADDRCLARFQSLIQAEQYANLLKQQQADWKLTRTFTVRLKDKVLVSI